MPMMHWLQSNGVLLLTGATGGIGVEVHHYFSQLTLTSPIAPLHKLWLHQQLYTGIKRAQTLIAH